jgi:hypothetical protein
MINNQVNIIAEPGRFFCTSPFALSVTVNATRIRFRTPKQARVHCTQMMMVAMCVSRAVGSTEHSVIGVITS